MMQTLVNFLQKKPAAVACAALFFLAVFALPVAYVFSNPTGLILHNGSGSQGAQYTPGFNAWSNLAYGNPSVDSDAMQVYLSGSAIPSYTNIQICMQEYDQAYGWYGANWGPVQCTGWASGGASWMPWVSEPDWYNPDGFRILVQTTGISNYSISQMRLGVQIADRGSDQCNTNVSNLALTPYISQGGGWSPVAGWINDFDCARIYMEPHWVYNPLPDLTASQTNYIAAYTGVATNFSYTINNVSAGGTSSGVRSLLHFDYNADGYGGVNDFSVTTDGATLAGNSSRVVTVSVTMPVSGTWNAIPVVDPNGQISESNEGNNYPAWDSFTVAPPPNPTVSLQARNVTTGGSWSGADLNITAEDQVQMQWSSTNASSCSKSFTSGTAVTGGPVDITEPFAGIYTDYTITCTGLTGTTPASDTIRLTAASALPILIVNDVDELVRRGDSVEFTWDLNGNDLAGCSFGGPGAPASVGGADNPFSVAIQGASTYTLTCAGGAAEVDMQVLPEVFES